MSIVLERLTHLFREKPAPQNFSEETHLVLENAGYLIFPPAIAIDPQQLFIPKSFNQPFARQQRFLQTLEDRVKKELGVADIRLIIGSPPTIIRLDPDYYQRVGRLLLVDCFTRTSQEEVIVGRIKGSDILIQSRTDLRYRFPDLGLLQLVRPL